MPVNNCFRHQQYPTAPSIPPEFHHLTTSGAEGFDFSRLHTELGVSEVVVVHGTFMGDDPFAISDMIRSFGKTSPLLKKPLDALAKRLSSRLKPITDGLTKDIGNYSDKFLVEFQELVGDDPRVGRLDPTWSGQNHHLARADMAVRLFCRLMDAAPTEDEVILFWGHSHAGNGFALLSNLLANDQVSVTRFFDACGPQDAEHWKRAQSILQRTDGPHPFARSVCIAAFGTPVRYGWDTNGYRSLVHILHHRNADGDRKVTAHPVFPFQSAREVVAAQHGDWVQAFAIAGTDVASPTSLTANSQLNRLFEDSLEDPVHELDTKFLGSDRIRDLCARWKTGTRCHADGLNLLVDYEPSGRKLPLGIPIEEAIFGHGVATTVDWLPRHLKLVTEELSRAAGRR